MEEADRDWMIGMVGGWVFLLVPAHPGSPGQRAVKWLLLLLLLEVCHLPVGCKQLLQTKWHACLVQITFLCILSTSHNIFVTYTTALCRTFSVTLLLSIPTTAFILLMSTMARCLSVNCAVVASGRWWCWSDPTSLGISCWTFSSTRSVPLQCSCYVLF